MDLYRIKYEILDKHEASSYLLCTFSVLLNWPVRMMKDHYNLESPINNKPCLMRQVLEKHQHFSEGALTCRFSVNCACC